MASVLPVAAVRKYGWYVQGAQIARGAEHVSRRFLPCGDLPK